MKKRELISLINQLIDNRLGINESFGDNLRRWEDDTEDVGQAPTSAADAADTQIGNDIDENIPIEPLLKRFLLSKSVLTPYLTKKQSGEIPCNIPGMDGKTFVNNFVKLYAQACEQMGKTQEVREKLLNGQSIE
jgi:hypothetical protein